MYNGTSASGGSHPRKTSGPGQQQGHGGLAQKYDDEKERITKSCFAKVDEQGQCMLYGKRDGVGYLVANNRCSAGELYYPR